LTERQPRRQQRGIGLEGVFARVLRHAFSMNAAPEGRKSTVEQFPAELFHLRLTGLSLPDLLQDHAR
jgi:hypothetical protein